MSPGLEKASALHRERHTLSHCRPSWSTRQQHEKVGSGMGGKQSVPTMSHVRRFLCKNQERTQQRAMVTNMPHTLDRSDTSDRSDRSDRSPSRSSRPSTYILTCRYEMLCRICTVQIQPRKTCPRTWGRSYRSYRSYRSGIYIYPGRPRSWAVMGIDHTDHTDHPSEVCKHHTPASASYRPIES